MTPQGSVFYRTRNGGLSRAQVADGALKAEPRGTSSGMGEAKIDRILGGTDDALVVSIESIAAVSIGGKVYNLAASAGPIAAQTFGDRTVLVCKGAVNVYHRRVWKILASIPAGPDRATAIVGGAFDTRKEIVFVLSNRRLRVWSLDSVIKHEEGRGYDDLPADVSQLALDSEARVLYAIAGKEVLSWRLKD